MHIEEALAGVPRAERCQCRERKAEDRGTSSPGPTKSWFSRLFGG